MSKLIGEGGFGCVFYPSLTCKGKVNQTKKFVSKIQVLDKYIIRELNISKIIIKIPNYTIFFSPIIKSCKINIATFDSQYIKDCDIINNNINKKFILSKIPYIEGKEFRTYINTIDDLSEYLYILTNSYYYLLNSLQILYMQNICHYDIKFENIIYNNNTNKPIIIDFGLSFLFSDIMNFNSIKNLKQYFYIYAPQYYIWTPEIQIISYIVNNNYENKSNLLTESLLTKIINEIIINMNIWSLFTNNFKEKYRSNMMEFFLQFINKNNNQVIHDLIQFKSTWDSYSINISFIRELIFKIKKTSNFQKYQTFFIILSQIFLYGINPNPNLRLSLSQLKEYLYNTFVSDFTQNKQDKFISYSLSDTEYSDIKTYIIPHLHLFKNK